MFEARQRELNAQAQRDVAQAWHVAAFASAAIAGKLPALSEVLRHVTQQVRRVSPEAQRTRMALLSEHLGVPMREATPATLRALQRLRAPHG